MKECPINMNGVEKNVDLNIISLRSYDFSITLDGMENNHVILGLLQQNVHLLGGRRETKVSVRDTKVNLCEGEIIYAIEN